MKKQAKPTHIAVLACLLAAIFGRPSLVWGQSTMKWRSPSAKSAATLELTDPHGATKTTQAQRLDRQPGEPKTTTAPGLSFLKPARDAEETTSEQPTQEEIPPPGDNLRIPLAQSDSRGELEVTGSGNVVSLVAREASLGAVLTMLAEHAGLNILLTEAINAQVTITLKDVRLEDALDAIVSITGNTWTRKNNIILVSSIANAGPLATGAQGTEMRVFELDYASSDDVAKAVGALLSPLGRSFAHQMDKADNHKTKEMVAVEDLPHVIRQIESYIRQIDTPPRQVLIEAHILKIDLKKTDQHGVNLNRVFSLLGHQLQLQTLGFASASDTPAFFGSFNGNQMGALIECLQSVSDAKTLAQPKVLCLNGQEAAFQVGQKLGYKLISTSQTSTLQSINFLNVGVILHVTPRISRDDQILMNIKPEVSDGSVDQSSGLPTSNTTTVATDVLLPDSRGIVIGGLIQESDTANVSKIPVLGDIWVLGRLFQKRNIVRERAEVIIFLVPRIVPFDSDYECITNGEMARAQMPLLGEQFARQRRPGEMQLYDAVENPRNILPRNQSSAGRNSRPAMRPVLSVTSTVDEKAKVISSVPPERTKPTNRPSVAKTSPKKRDTAQSKVIPASRTARRKQPAKTTEK